MCYTLLVEDVKQLLNGIEAMMVYDDFIIVFSLAKKTDYQIFLQISFFTETGHKGHLLRFYKLGTICLQRK